MTIINVTHETLIRHWPRLREWVHDDPEFKIWQDQILCPAAKKWLENNKKGWLLHEEQLVEAEVWLKKRPYNLMKDSLLALTAKN